MKLRRLTLAIVIIITGCNKGNLAPSTPTQTTTTPITVSINQSQKGAFVPSTFLGLSYETGILAESPDFLNENNAVLIQLLNNLGKGILRIGGNTSDETQWTGSARNSATPPHSLTTTDVDRLAAFSKAAGWPVFFGLNLGHFNPDTAALEADYVFNKLQNNLAALQIGNEPDAFKNHLRPANYNFLDYQKEWNEYYNAVKKRVPKAHFTGPDVIPYDAGWISSFANSERGNIHLLGSHYYYAGPASDPSINYHTLLSNNVKLQDHLLQLSNTASKYKVPFRITEGNSVYGGGKPGVSDVFASALWALNFMWVVAESNGQGVNFHGGEPRFAYTPITMENGVVSARPEYYAMLAFRDGAVGGKIIPATIYNPRAYDNCSVYACANVNGTYSVTLINKEDSKNFSFTIQLSQTASSIQVSRLAAPSITATTGTTFGGAEINADGSFTPPRAVEQTINSKTFVVNVPAGSAAVVLIH
jgi:hypothetical protein